MLDCSVAAAREHAHVERLDRKISRDGKKRAKLNAGLVAVFIARIKTMDLAIDQAVEFAENSPEPSADSVNEHVF